MALQDEVDSALALLNSFFAVRVNETGRVGVWLNHVPFEAERPTSRLFESGVRMLSDWPSNRWTDGVNIIRMLSTAEGDVELRAVLWWGPADDVAAGLTPEYIHGRFRLFRDNPRIRDYAFRIGVGDDS